MNAACIRAAVGLAAAALAVTAAVVTPTTASFVDDGAVTTGLATTPERQVVFTDVEAGLDHTLALTDDGRVYAWGRNTNGQVGDPMTGTFTTRAGKVDVSSEPVVDIAAGRFVSIALDSAGAVYTWGDSSVTAAGSTPTRVEGLPSNIVGISAGGVFFLAWTEDGLLYSWGNNGSGRLGRGERNVDDRSPGRVTAAGGGTGIAGADAGRFGGVAWTASGAVYTWGEGRNYADGITVSGVPAGPIKQAEQGADTTMLLMESGVMAYSVNSDAFLTQSGISDATMISAAVADSHESETFLAYTSAGLLYAWWDNGYGQYGDGTTSRSEYPRAISLAPLGSPALTDLASADFHSVVLTADGTPLLTGANSFGQLGTGNLTNATSYAALAPVRTWP